MGEFLGLGQVGAAFQLFLDEILHRLDIMVGGAFGVLDLSASAKLESGDDATQEIRLFGGRCGQFGNAGFGCRCDQPSIST